MRGFSIIVCCYNSSERISPTLRHIFALTLPPGCTAELIVVDNNSTDDTARVVRSLIETGLPGGFSFRLETEPLPGQSFARQRGIAVASTPWILFCDDDNHLQADYLVNAEALLRDHPDAGILGGMAHPGFEAKEAWLQDFYPAMAVGPQAPQDGYVPWVYGAGMVVRREVFERLNNRNIQFLLSGRAGNGHSAGDDAEICNLAAFVGFRIYYSSKLLLRHAVSGHRLRKSHYTKGTVSSVAPSVHLFILEKVITDQAPASSIYRRKIRVALRNLFYFAPRLLFGKHRFYSYFMFYRTIQMIMWLAVNRKEFKKMFNDIVNNLSLQNRIAS